MKRFVIAPTRHTPEISFDILKEELMFRGFSVPENAFDFFQPLCTWFEDNRIAIEENVKHLKINIDLEYLNSSSLKFIVSFVKHCVVTTGGDNVQIMWHFDSDDEDSIEKGRDLSSVIELPVTLVERSKRFEKMSFNR